MYIPGVCFFGDASILPVVSRGRIRRLNLAESNVTDLLLRKITACCANTVSVFTPYMILLYHMNDISKVD